MANHWVILGIKSTNDKRQIKRAYSTLLKKTKPESDPEGYQRLREAFDQAIKIAGQQSRPTPNAEHIITPSDSNIENGAADNHLDSSGEFANFNALVEEERLVASEAETDGKREQALHQIMLEERRRQAELLAEQQLAEDSTREQELAEYSMVERSVEDVLACLDQDASIQRFKQLVVSEEFVSINARRKLDGLFFQTAISWSREKEFPGAVFETIAREFAWFESGEHSGWDQHELDYLQNRLRAHGRIVALRALAKRRAWGENATDIRVARILLSKFSKARFLRIAVMGSHHELLKATVAAYQSDVDNGFLPELDTPTFAWWRERFESHYFGMAHLLGGAIIGILILAVVQIQTSAEGRVIHPAVYLYILMGSVTFGSAIFWCLTWLSSKGWKILSNFYGEKIDYWVQTPQVYRNLTIGYLITFILPVLWPGLGLIQILGYCLVIVTLKASVVYVVFGGAIYELMLTGMQLDKWSKVVSADFVLVGLTTYFTFFYFLGNLPDILPQLIPKNKVHQLLLYIPYSCLLAVALLKGVLFVVEGFNSLMISG